MDARAIRMSFSSERRREANAIDPKWNDTIGEWEAERVRDRILKCRAMLYLHGFLTEAENERIRARIRRLTGLPLP